MIEGAYQRQTPPLTRSPSHPRRDVLLNLTVKGCPLVMELQLHLKDVIKLKKAGHRIYGTPAALVSSEGTPRPSP